MISDLKNEVDKLGNNICIGLKGVNLFDVNKQLYVNKRNLTTSGRDTVMFKYTSNCRFIQTVNYELFQSNYKIHRISTCFYHLKSCPGKDDTFKRLFAKRIRR